LLSEKKPAAARQELTRAGELARNTEAVEIHVDFAITDAKIRAALGQVAEAHALLFWIHTDVRGTSRRARTIHEAGCRRTQPS